MLVDVTNEVYTRLKTELVGHQVLKAYPNEVPTFPLVVVDELESVADDDTRDSGGFNADIVSLSINIFSNTSNKSEEIKAIRKQIDTIMSDEWRMTRTVSRYVPNFIDINVDRYLLTYSFKIDKNKVIYRI